MILINYPSPDFRIKEGNSKKYIWDIIRKKWILLTPEEWVRQNFVQYLIKEKNVPKELIAVEKSIEIVELKKRFDIVVYKEMKPWLIVECKEMGVPLNTRVFEQIVRYNLELSGSFLIITNGEFTKGWCVKNGFFEEISLFPEWRNV